jgi:type VI secretion system protein ImpA
MLSQSTLDSLSQPISADEPSGPDLAYDADFIALEALAKPKAEQQFGDSIMAAEEPNWGQVAEKSEALLLRSKDFRVSSYLVRALTQKDGIKGFVQGTKVLLALTDNFWDTLHPSLDADDDNDPTMRVNALAPLWDYDMLLKDLHEARLGVGSGAGAIKVKDVEAHFSKSYMSTDGPSFSIDQIQATLTELQESDPSAFEAMQESLDLTKQLQSSINDKVGAQSSIDLAQLQAIAFALHQAVQAIKGVETSGNDQTESGGTASAAGGTGGGGALKSRDDAVRLLSQVITFLEKTEPGNPAPLLIKRAQRLIGMNFIDIINDLAPDALNTVQNIAGRSDDS